MTPNLFIPFQLCGTFQKVLPGEQGIPPKPAADLGQGTLYLLFPLKSLIIDQETQLVISVILMDSIRIDTEPSVQQPVVCFRIKGL